MGWTPIVKLKCSYCGSFLHKRKTCPNEIMDKMKKEGTLDKVKEKLKSKPKVEIPKEIPPLGLTTKATVIRVVDGDTVEVEIRRTFKVRLLDRWKAELNTEEGKEEKRKLEEKIKVGDELTLFVPSNQPERLMDLNSFDRILGHLYTKDGERL